MCKSNIVCRAGVVFYATVSMSRKRANSFALCLLANKRFAAAEVIPAGKSEAAGYRVAYLPASAERVEVLRTRLQAEQDIKAREALAAGEITVRLDRATGAHLVTSKSRAGKVHTVSGRTCTCEATTYTYGPACIECFHVRAVDIQQARQKEHAAARRAEIDSLFN